MIPAVAVLLVVVVLLVMPGQAVATVADAPVTAVAWAMTGEPRARAPPPERWRRWTRPKAPVLSDLTQSRSPSCKPTAGFTTECLIRTTDLTMKRMRALPRFVIASSRDR